MSTVRFCPEAPFICGNSSAVEHRLAKAGVASSNLVSRSNFIWRHSQAVRQRSAKPLFPSSILGAASTIVTHAGVAEQADATDLKSVGWKQPYRFDSGPRHQLRLTSVSLFFLSELIKSIAMNDKPKLLISECLCGVPCRYDGKDNYIEALDLLNEYYELVPVCPEVLGGLCTPREPAERQGNRICTADGTDVTTQFIRGAELTVRIAIEYKCEQALLKAKSPSCGYKRIYDGSFTRTLTDGHGCTVEALLAENIRIYTEHDIDLLLAQKKR